MRESLMAETYYYLKTVGGPEVTGKNLESLWELTHIVRGARVSLDPEPLIARLAEDAVYESQDVMDPLSGKSEIAEYLRKRFE